MNNKGSFIPLLLLIAATATVVGYLAYSRISDANETEPENISLNEMAEEQNTKPPIIPFSFSAAGDFDDTSEAKAVLSAIGEQNADFTLALGDLGYVGLGNEAEWCKLVKDRVGKKHPFELVAGNHDDGSRDGDIREYAKCLPDRLGNINGDYGIEYYFDYNKVARFIMISPDIDNYGFSYTNGSKHLKWVVDRVNEARKSSIEWIVVGMHKNCITPGDKECEISDDLLNKLVELKVDLILQGHEHSYFRSKQLALNAESCPAIVINSFNESCISDSDNKLEKGEGTVIVISGAGGRRQRNVNFQDAEFNYFKAVSGANSNESFGFSLFEISDSGLNASFVPAIGKFKDSFSIR